MSIGTSVTCELADGCKRPGTCVTLRKALYGLRDVPLVRFEELQGYLHKLALDMCKDEPCLFVYNRKNTILLIFFVDDIVMAYYKNVEEDYQELITGLKQA